MGLAITLFSCSQKPDSLKFDNELAVGQNIEMEWGHCTLNEKNGDRFLALEISDWPTNGMLGISGLKLKVKDIYLQSKPSYHFAWRFYKGELQIHTSSLKPDKTSKVLLVKTKGKVLFANSYSN